MTIFMRRLACLSLALCLIEAAVLPQTIEAVEPAAMARKPHVDRLRLHQVHTGESIDVAYKVDGEYTPGGIAMLNHFLRDYRVGADASYDPREFDLLHALLRVLGRPDAVIDVLCGYRSPQTNEMLRERVAVSGVARDSLHMQSKAIDIAIPGVSTERLRDAALALHMGGVGYYPSSHFVHVDVGPVRQWSFGVRLRQAHIVRSVRRRHRVAVK